MTDRDANRRTVERVLLEFFTAGRSELAPELFTPGLVEHHPDPPHETRGHDGIRERISAWRAAFPDLSTSIEDLVAEGDRVALRSVARGTHLGEFAGTAPTGRAIAVDWQSIYRFEVGRVAEMWDAWNMLAVMEQLGLAPRPGG